MISIKNKNLNSYFLYYTCCRNNFCFKDQRLDHVGTLDNLVIPHWKENLLLSITIGHPLYGMKRKAFLLMWDSLSQKWLQVQTLGLGKNCPHTCHFEMLDYSINKFVLIYSLYFVCYYLFRGRLKKFILDL